MANDRVEPDRFTHRGDKDGSLASVERQYCKRGGSVADRVLLDAIQRACESAARDALIAGEPLLAAHQGFVHCGHSSLA